MLSQVTPKQCTNITFAGFTCYEKASKHHTVTTGGRQGLVNRKLRWLVGFVEKLLLLDQIAWSVRGYRDWLKMFAIMNSWRGWCCHCSIQQWYWMSHIMQLYKPHLQSVHLQVELCQAFLWDVIGPNDNQRIKCRDGETAELKQMEWDRCLEG